MQSLTLPIKSDPQAHDLAARLVKKQLMRLFELTHMVCARHAFDGSPFVGISWSIEDRREVYLEFGQRMPIHLGEMEHILLIMRRDGTVIRLQFLPRDGTLTQVGNIESPLELINVVHNLCHQALIQNALSRLKESQASNAQTQEALFQTEARLKDANARLDLVKQLFSKLQD